MAYYDTLSLPKLSQFTILTILVTLRMVLQSMNNHVIPLISAAVFFLLCWKSIRVLFMKMVDWEVARADSGGGGEKRRTEIGTEFKGAHQRVSLTVAVPSLDLQPFLSGVTVPKREATPS